MKVTLDIKDFELLTEIKNKENINYEKQQVHAWLFKKSSDNQIHRLVISTEAIWNVNFLIRDILEQNNYEIVLEWFGPAWAENVTEDEICYSFRDITSKLEKLENNNKNN